MRIQFMTEGGLAYFPGLNKPVTIDTAHLPAGEAAMWEGLVRSTHFFTVPERASPAVPGAADYRQYTIMVDDGGQRHSIRLDEPVTDPGLRTLVEHLLAHMQARRSGTGASSDHVSPPPHQDATG